MSEITLEILAKEVKDLREKTESFESMVDSFVTKHNIDTIVHRFMAQSTHGLMFVTKHNIEEIVFNYMMSATKSLVLEQWKNEHIKNEIENQIKTLVGK
jgi:predicted metal-dependent hydrolase